MQKEQMLEVEFRKTYDVFGAVPRHEVFLKLYLSFFTSGLVAALGPERTVALLALASFMDEKGRCYPTNEQIAERIGVHRSTATKWVGKLLDFRWNDRPVVTRTKVKSANGYTSSVYTVLPISQLAIFDGEIEPCSESAHGYVTGSNMAMCQTEPTHVLPSTLTRTNKPEPIKQDIAPSEPNGQGAGAVTPKLRNARDVVIYFMEKYRETYNVNYAVNWTRDSSLVKKKLLPNYTMSQIEEMIGLVFREYGRRWANQKYPRPTIGQLCSWLCNEAMAVLDREKQEQEEIARRMETAGAEADDVDAVLKRLSKGGRE